MTRRPLIHSTPLPAHRLRRSITRTPHLTAATRVYLLGIGDPELEALHVACLETPDMTASYVAARLSERGVRVSCIQVCVFFAFLGRPKGHGRRTRRPYKAPSLPETPAPAAPIDVLREMPPRLRLRLRQEPPQVQAQIVAGWREMLEDERAEA